MARDNIVKVRFNAEEYIQAKELSAEVKYPFAEFCRLTILDNRPLEIKPTSERRKINHPNCDPQLIREIAKIGNNINQLTKIINTKTNANQPFDLLQLSAQIEDMNNQLLELRKQYSVENNVS